MQAFLPAYDGLIEKKYSVGSVEQKLQNKTALQKSLGWAMEPKRPMICLPGGMTDALGGALFKEVLPGILTLQMELLVLGKGSSTYGSMFTKLAEEERYRVHIVAENEADIHRMYAAADMALFLTDEQSEEERTHCLQYGVVPVSPAMPRLDDYNPVQETGNAFLFEQPTKWNVFAAIVRAVETYKFPFDWRTIQRHAMETVSERERMRA